MLRILNVKSRRLSDLEVVKGLQRNDRHTEDGFYKSAKHYFDNHFNEVFFDKDRKQEIFQMAFLKLWTEIHNKKITLIENHVCRQQKNGEYVPMSCQLTTFLMTFAKNEYRELVRTNRLDTYEDVYDNVNTADVMVTTFDAEEDAEAQKARIIDDCIQTMSPRCIDILTMFYYEGRSLDEILTLRNDKNTSKNGLKTAKNKCMNTLRERATTELQRFCLIT